MTKRQTVVRNARHRTLQMVWLSNLSTLTFPYKGYPRNALNMIYTCLLLLQYVFITFQ